MLVDECVGQLCEPSLTQTAAEEKQEAARAKRTVHLLRVLAEFSPSQFTDSDVFQNLISLLRHDDSEIGGWGSGCGQKLLIYFLAQYITVFDSVAVDDTLQILTHTGANIDQTVAGYVV